MDFIDELGNLLPFLIFTIIVILGNLGDKKKPKAKMKTKPFPKGSKLPDIRPPAGKGIDMPQPPVQIEAKLPEPILQPKLPRKHRSHHPDEYEQVHNTYQSYLEKKYPQGTDETQTSHEPSASAAKARQAANQGGNLLGLENLSLAQAILSAEILGQPRCRQRRIR